MECRESDRSVRELLGKLDHSSTHQATCAERAMLALLHGGCSVPVGGWGRIEAGQLVLDGLVASLDGSQILKATARGDLRAAEQVGHQVAEKLLTQGAAEIITAARDA